MALPDPFTRPSRIWLLCIAPVVCACGRDGGIGGPDGEPVAAVFVSGAPVDPLIVSYTVQLAAAPLNASGAVLSGRKVLWSSSDSGVASVTAGGLVRALRAGPAVIVASSEGKQGSAVLDVRDAGTIGTAGGTLSLLEGALTLRAQAGSVMQTTTVLARPAGDAPQHPRAVNGTQVELSPQPLAFSRPLSMTLRYDASKVPSEMQEASLQLHSLSGGAWIPLRGSVVDRQARTVTADIPRTGIYAIASTPVNRVSLTGPAVDGAVYEGANVRLLATALDAAGDTLRQFQFQWTSSNPGVATVDVNGNITGVSSGTATIVVTAAEASATTTIRVLPVPAVDWSRAADWVTYHGNARRNGFIDATVDPTRFAAVWTTQVGTSPPRVESMATAGNRVFTTTTYDSYSRLIALAAEDGREVWSYSLGPTTHVTGPSWGDGSVYVQTAGSDNSFLWSFNETGQLRYRSAYLNQWWFWNAPAVADSGVYIGGGLYGGLYRFDARTGTQTYFVSLAQADGWAPTVADGTVYLIGTNASIYGAGLLALSAADGKLRYSIWDSRLAAPLTTALGSLGNVVVCGNSGLVATDLVAKRIAWEKYGACTGVPTVGRGIVFVVSLGAVEAVGEADGLRRWLWTPPGGEVAVSPMIATNNVLFVALRQKVYPSPSTRTVAIDIASGRVVWSHPAAGTLAVSAQGMLFVLEPSGRMHGVRLR